MESWTLLEKLTAGKSYKYVNTTHPEQDINSTRLYRPGMFRFKLAAELVPPPDSPQVACLEIGGGAAEFSQWLRKVGYQVTFADLNPNSVERACALGFESLLLDFNYGLPGLADASFDLVVMLEVIEHIVNAEMLLAEAQRVLKPGGCLVLSTPNFAWWRNRLGILLGHLSVDEGYHYRFFTFQSLARQLRQAGFQIEKWRFSSPAFGINRFNRLFRQGERMHVHVPKWAAPIFAQTMLVQARKDGQSRTPSVGRK
jgi:2-polyprenyl-3-methyl-5-hydroxy-6-metoxy-1,4-benzoquinol methylase